MPFFPAGGGGGGLDLGLSVKNSNNDNKTTLGMAPCDGSQVLLINLNGAAFMSRHSECGMSPAA